MLDLSIALRTALTTARLQAAHAGSGSGEYAALEVVTIADLPGFVARVAGHLTPQAAVFLACIGALRSTV